MNVSVICKLENVNVLSNYEECILITLHLKAAARTHTFIKSKALSLTATQRDTLAIIYHLSNKIYKHVNSTFTHWQQNLYFKQYQPLNPATLYNKNTIHSLNYHICSTECSITVLCKGWSKIIPSLKEEATLFQKNGHEWDQVLMDICVCKLWMDLFINECKDLLLSA